MPLPLLNSENIFFESRFKRSPKIWSISNIHTLWKRVNDRLDIRRLEFSNYLNEIIKEVVPNKKGEYIVYYRIKKEIFAYSITKRYGNSYSTNRVELKNREEKIDILIEERKFILGEELYRLEKFCSSKFKFSVGGILCRMIDKEFHSKFGNTKYSSYYFLDENQIIQIDGHRYLYNPKNGSLVKEILEQEIIELK